jgi:hypothetical protein
VGLKTDHATRPEAVIRTVFVAFVVMLFFALECARP